MVVTTFWDRLGLDIAWVVLGTFVVGMYYLIGSSILDEWRKSRCPTCKARMY